MTTDTRLLTELLQAQESIAAAGLDVAELLLTLARRARDLTGADGAYVELVDADAVVVRAAADSAAVHVGESLLDAGSTGRAFVARRLVHWNRKGLGSPVGEGRGAADAVWGAPLDTGDRVLGVVTVVAGRSGAFGKDAEHALRVLTRFTVHQIGHATRLELAERTSRLDPLTGLGNRRALDECLGRELHRHIRYERSLSLCLVDLDGFKAVNDTHGHAAGDRVLAQVGRRLCEIRGTDAAFRLGGDEFAVVLPETAAGSAELVARRLVRQIREDTFPTEVSATWGIAEATGSDPAELLAAADQELYARKRSSKGNEATG